MGLSLYPHQAKQAGEIDNLWSVRFRNVLAVAATGSGKTVIAAHAVKQHVGRSIVIAHRQELVSQLSLAIAKEGVSHNIIGPRDGSVVKLCVKKQMDVLGKQFFDPEAKCSVGGVDTLLRRANDLAAWGRRQTLWVQDEAHHLQKNNKWGKVISLFPNAKGLGFTATPRRNDHRGLGSWNDGVFDVMSVGPEPRWLIENGWLSDYRIFAPPNDLDMSKVEIGRNGDYKQNQSAKAIRRSSIMGDVVAHYLRLARGKLGITFAVDVKEATEISDRFNAAGVPSSVIHAGTSDSERYNLLKKYQHREILQLVNVDIFGEGFDLPAIEVCSFARPTASWGLYVQQFGRALRRLEGKTHAIIIDHVGNVLRHNGPPDRKVGHTLEREEKRASAKLVTMVRVCGNPMCNRVYDRFLPVCPYCGFKEVPGDRSKPEYVDGDLVELTPEAIAQMTGEIRKVDMSPEEYQGWLLQNHCPHAGVSRNVIRHQERYEAQMRLRRAMSLWGGMCRAQGRIDSESYRLFYLLFGIDVLSAQAVGVAEAQDLESRIIENLKTEGVV